MNRKVLQTPTPRGRPVELPNAVKIKTLFPRDLVEMLTDKYPNVPMAKALRLAVQEVCAK